MDARIDQFLHELHELSEPRIYYRQNAKLRGQIAEWIAADEVQLLADLAEEIASTSGVLASLASDITLGLAKQPGIRWAEAAVKLRQPPSSDADSRAHYRRLAAVLADAQPLDVLEELFRHKDYDRVRPGPIELFGPLIQEMVLRGTNCEGIPKVTRYWARLRTWDVPLLILPLRLLDLEVALLDRDPPPDLFAPRNSPRSKSVSEAPRMEGVVIATDGQRRMNCRGTAPASLWSRILQMSSAVMVWYEASNGIAEAGEFTVVDDGVLWEVTAPLLFSLDLECLGSVPPDGIHIDPVELHSVVWRLHHAAADGGAYGEGVGGAYGRLAMWRTLRALVGAPDEAEAEAVAALAEQCHWFTFFARSGWFFDIVWDIALAVIRPDGRSLAILAASDTD